MDKHLLSAAAMSLALGAGLHNTPDRPEQPRKITIEQAKKKAKRKKKNKQQKQSRRKNRK